MRVRKFRLCKSLNLSLFCHETSALQSAKNAHLKVEKRPALFMNSHQSPLLSAIACAQIYSIQTRPRGQAIVLSTITNYNFNKLSTILLEIWLRVELLLTTSFLPKCWLGTAQHWAMGRLQGRKSWEGSTFKGKNDGTI